MNDNPVKKDSDIDENSSKNTEWQLSELIDAIAAEVDRAQDTLSLKSYGRGLSFAIKKLNLDLEVKVRRAEDGKFLFRTIDSEPASSTVLKLDFAQVLQNQLTDVRKSFDDISIASSNELQSLTDITSEHTTALDKLGIHSIDDLKNYAQTPLMITELSRKTQIEEVLIRQWLELPLIREIKPNRGLASSIVVIEGDNFGNQSEQIKKVIFQQKTAKIVAWEETRLTVVMPEDVIGSGMLFVQVGNQVTNTVLWEATGIDLCVRDISITPSDLVEGEELIASANLINLGTTASEMFEVQWEIDGQKQQPQLHGSLQPQQNSEESVSKYHFSPSKGFHIIRFLADPAEKLLDINRKNGSFTKQIFVRPIQKITIGDFRSINTLNPLLSEDLGPADVMNLIFRGLGRFDPETGNLLPDIAKSWHIKPLNNSIFLLVHIQKNLHFHNGNILTASDVLSTYKKIVQYPSCPWNNFIRNVINFEDQNQNPSISIDKNNSWIVFKLQPKLASDLTIKNNSVLKGHEQLLKLLTLGILPQDNNEESSIFSTKINGIGPFQVKAFEPNKIINLEASPNFRIRPRLDKINIYINQSKDTLIELLKKHKITAAVLPYSEELESEFSNAQWKILSFRNLSQPLLYVQSLHLNERLLNPFDINWNAYLWYLQEIAGK